VGIRARGGDDGFGFDHSDWADAQLIPVTTDSGGASFVFLSDMNWMSAVSSEMVLTVPRPYCGWRTAMPMWSASIFMGGI
jgi:hypothetical protein